MDAAPIPSSSLLAGLPAASLVLPALLQQLPNGVMYLLPVYARDGRQLLDFRFGYLNPAAQRLLRLPPQPTTTYLQQFPASVTSGDFAFHQQALEVGGEWATFAPFYPVDGQGPYLRAQACRVDQGLLVSFTAAEDPLPTRVELALRGAQAAEQAARAEAQTQQQQFAEILRHLPAQVATYYGPDLIYTFVNERYQGYFPAQELLGRSVREAMAAVAEQGFFDLLDRVYRTGEPYYGVELPVRLDFSPSGRGQQLFINTCYHPLRNAHGEIEGVLDFSYEVTEHVRARQQVERLNQELEFRVRARTQEAEAAQATAEQQRTRLLRLFDEAPAGICVLAGPELVFEFVNARYQTLLPNRELVGQPALDALPELVGQPVAALLRGVYETGITYEGREMLIQFYSTLTGTLEDRYFNFIYQARYDAARSIDGLIVFAFEITEEVRGRQAVEASAQQALTLAAELAKTNAQLVRTNVDLDNFIYTASHDLKTPISNIEGLLLLLRQQLPPAVQRAGLVPRVLGLMQQSVERFRLTIAQLTDLTRLQQVHAEPSQVVDLSALVEDVRQDLAPLLEAANAQLTVTLASGTSVQFAPQHLRSILYNLLSNAVKYRQPDRAPQVQLRCWHEEQQTVLEVQDNGLGLSPSQQGKLFGLFQRLHRHVAGSGVGLYMVKRMVENRGGTLTVASEVGVGSTFRVCLPN